MVLESLCPPAILYVAFSLTQVIIDIFKNMYNTAFFKFLVMIVFTIVLNILCQQGLGVISWFIVFVPFIMMTLITTLLLFVFGLSPSAGKLDYTVDYPGRPASPPAPLPASQDAIVPGPRPLYTDSDCGKAGVCPKGCAPPNSITGNCQTTTHKDSKGGYYRTCPYECPDATAQCKYDQCCKGCGSRQISVDSAGKGADPATPKKSN